MVLSADDKLSYYITDSSDKLLGKEEDLPNLRQGQGIGMFVRGSTKVDVTAFTVKEGAHEPSIQTTADPFTGTATPIFSLKDVKSTLELPAWFANAYKSDGKTANTEPMTATVENGVLTATNKEDTFGVVGLYDYADALKNGNAYKVSATFSISRWDTETAWPENNSSDKHRAGIAFNAPNNIGGGEWYVLNSKSECVYQIYKDGKGSTSKANLAAVENIAENTVYTMVMSFNGDAGMYTLEVFNATTGTKLHSQDGQAKFDVAKNFGIMVRNATVTVTDYTITAYAAGNDQPSQGGEQNTTEAATTTGKTIITAPPRVTTKAPETAAPTDAATTTAAPAEKGGCGGFVAVLPVVVIGAAAGAVLTLRKKNDEE